MEVIDYLLVALSAVLLLLVLVRKVGAKRPALVRSEDGAETGRVADQSQGSSLLDLLPLCVYRVDREGRLVYVNQTLREELGLPLEQILGKSATDFYAAEMAIKYRQDDAKVLATAKPLHLVEENRVPGREERRFVEVFKVPVCDDQGRVQAIQGMFWDVTARILAEQALEQSRQQLLDAQCLAGMGDFTWDLESDEVAWSEGVRQLLKYRQDEAIDYPKVNREIHHPDDLAEVNRWLREGIASGAQTLAPKEYRLIRKDGVVLDVQTHARIEHRHGRPWKVFGTCLDITDLKRTEQALKASEERLLESQRVAQLGHYTYYITADRWESSLQLDEIYGIDRDYPRSISSWLDIVHPDQREDMADYLRQQVLGQRRPFNREYKIRPINRQQERWVQGQGELKLDAAGRPLELFGTVQDITERKQVEGKLELAAKVFVHAREGILITDPQGVIIEANDALSRISGYSRAELLGQTPRVFRSGRHDGKFVQGLWEELAQQGYWVGEIWNRRKNGEIYAALLTISAAKDERGRISQYLALYSDITAQKEHQRQLEYIAHYDVITGLPNRVLFSDRLRQAMAQCRRRGQLLALVYLDLDGFKEVNDTYGHDQGDRLLASLAGLLKRELRQGDTIARLGGDEFVAVLIDLEQQQTALSVVERLLTAARQPMQLDNLRLEVSASIGVTFYPQADELGGDQLLRQADQAMYAAKMRGKNRYQLASPRHE